MGTIREYGYREYPDNLTPGKGGESNLLFDSAGALTGHAPFHPAERDSSEEQYDPDDSVDEDLTAKSLLTAAAVIVGIGAACYGVAKLAPRAVAAIRARRRDRVASAEIDAGGGPEDAQEESEDLLAHCDDPQEALINEVKALCSQGPATTASTDGDQLAPADADEDESATNPRRLRKRRGSDQ